jgi:hypothetical protein
LDDGRFVFIVRSRGAVLSKMAGAATAPTQAVGSLLLRFGEGGDSECPDIRFPPGEWPATRLAARRPALRPPMIVLSLPTSRWRFLLRTPNPPKTVILRPFEPGPRQDREEGGGPTFRSHTPSWIHFRVSSLLLANCDTRCSDVNPNSDYCKASIASPYVASL